MKICKRCDAINADGAQFCCKCGAPLGASLHAGGQAGGYQSPQPSPQPGTYMGSPCQSQTPKSVGFGDAIRICLGEKYASFEGRATRSEYWCFSLFCIIVIIAAVILGGISGALISGGDMDVTIGVAVIIDLLVGIGLACPSISVFVRRLHDTGRSGWWYWICFIPYIGSIVLLVFMCLGSQERDNEYGPYIR